jgi:hypothetical protein
MLTITQDEITAVRATIARMGGLSNGLCTEEQACSIAAINLARTGRLTDEIPDCMSRVIGKWIIIVEDAMPESIRNSEEYLGLLPFAAGTGRAHEAERTAILMDWLFVTVLPYLHPLVDSEGFGEQWRAMCEQRTEEAARAAATAAATAANVTYADRAENAAAWATATAAREAAWAAATAAREAAATAANVVYWAANAAVNAAVASGARAEAWASFDVPGLLRRLILVSVTPEEMGDYEKMEVGK